MASSIVEKHSERQETINELGKKYHKIVDNFIKKYQSDSRKMESEDLNSIQDLKSEFHKLHLLIQSAIVENQYILASNDSSKLANYTSKHEKFRKVPPRFELTVLQFNPTELTERVFCQIIGDIPYTVKTGIQGQVLKAPKPVSKFEKPIRKFLDSPRLTGYINTGEVIHEIACIPYTDEFYVSGIRGIFKHNNEGKVLDKISTTKKDPAKITVTREGHLLYLDGRHGNITKVKSGKLKHLIRVNDVGWIPKAICCTLTNDILVLMTSLYVFHRPVHRQVVRYSSSRVMKEIQLSDIVFGSFPSHKYVPCIDENKNLDTVVNNTNSILVLNNEGKLRIKYDSNPESNKYTNFIPCGITNDSMCHILVADRANNITHIIDQNGQFLLFIDFQIPCDLITIDSNDILYVAEPETFTVNQIKYLE
ncbi:uncharacterized protein LOC133204297 [Saccostrea echinata]|uniref:uncharacterized protein LOC133204297 n=1 Tax=Saccostrea echinata TaxID=191078 RepID=UPI002A7FA1FD|nr:uncharacterized protein LOC133204297 [Saccostrea echinata]